jgi:signal transduction histidine kinase
LSGEPNHAIEEGVLPLFRLFVVLAVVLVALRAAVEAVHPSAGPVPSPWPGLVLLAGFLGYLSSAALRERLGRLYLPLALAFATLGPLLGSAGALKVRIEAGAPTDDLVRGAWALIVVLLVPVILVAWQYGFAWVIGYCVLASAADLAMSVPLAARGGPRPLTLVAIALVRCLFFVPVGYAVARLVDAQRRQREALREANTRLAGYAETLERLATSRERNRLAHELHDTLAQGLSAVAVQLEATAALWEPRPAEARTTLAEALATTRTALAEARRAIAALRASPLEDRGLAGAIRSLAESTASRAGLVLDAEIPDRLDGLPPEVEQVVYRIAAEALANVARHAQARRLGVRLEACPPGLSLSVADDGRGFNPAAPGDGGRFGLQVMRERAASIGAELLVESSPGSGTVVRLVVRRPDDPRPRL